MRNNSSRAGLHRYKRNLLFPFFALIFALPNLIGCTQVLPIEEGKQEINGSVKDCALLCLSACVPYSFALYSLFRFR